VQCRVWISYPLFLMSRRVQRAVAFAVAMCGVCSITQVALADDAQEQVLAQALFDEGRRLMDAKRFDEACPKLAESQRLDPGGGTLLNLAICYEEQGKLASAKNNFEEALALAMRDGRKDRQKIARERIAAIGSAVPHLTVVVPPASELDSLEVKLDGLVLRRAAWSVATPVDPGAHVIEAAAIGRAPWSSTVRVEVGGKKAVEVPVLGSLAPLPVAGGLAGSAVERVGVGGGVAVGGGARQGPPALEAQPSYPDLMLVRPPKPSALFYTVLTTTLVASGVSLVTGVMAFSADKDAKTGCLPERHFCRDQASADAADRASTMAWVSTVSLGVAAAGFVALLVLPSRSPSGAVTRSNSSRGSVRGSASVLPGGGAIGLAGAF